jgi:AcrR family transcriptional regulator
MSITNSTPGSAEPAVPEPLGSTPRQKLLDAAIEHISTNGFGEMSLRQLAAAIGTSHRMLLYHFGSREELLVEIMRGFEARQRAIVAEIAVAHLDDPAKLTRSIWKALSSDDLLPQVRAYFEVYGQALAAGPVAAEPLAQLLTDWLQPMEELERARGASRAEARANVRLGAAVLRGLLLDLAATGDRKACTAAHERWVRAVVDSSPR